LIAPRRPEHSRRGWWLWQGRFDPDRPKGRLCVHFRL